jgi:hypothetical protein
MANASAAGRPRQAPQKRLTEDQRVDAAMREASLRLKRRGLVLPTAANAKPKKRAS